MHERTAAVIGSARALVRRSYLAAEKYAVNAPMRRLIDRGLAPDALSLLETTGRRSGEPRTTPLMYLCDGERYIVSCEDYGQRRPAAWRLNLVACPDATIQVGNERIACSGRLLSDEEADRHWPRLLELWPAHATYRRRSGRRYTFELTPRQPPGVQSSPGSGSLVDAPAPPPAVSRSG